VTTSMQQAKNIAETQWQLSDKFTWKVFKTTIGAFNLVVFYRIYISKVAFCHRKFDE
jgi:hypothetical protein